MKVSADQMMNGIIYFMRSDVLRQIPDTNIKLMIGALMYGAENKADGLLRMIESNPIMYAVRSDDGMYDLDLMSDSLMRSITEYGQLTVSIPSIPLISKDEKKITFSADDIECLRRRIEEVR